MGHYGIRNDYRPRDEALTLVDDPAAYWTPQRIETSGFYQHEVYRLAAERLSRMDRRRFVDVGCGWPRKVERFILPLTDQATLIDQPSMRPLIAEAYPNLTFIPLDLETGTLPEGTAGMFDCVVCADVIEHLLDPDPLLQLIRKLLATGGVAVISTPERDAERGPGCLQSLKPEHVREWHFEEFGRYLSSGGLSVVEHHRMPKGRVSRPERLALPLLQRLNPRRYASCQAAVCRAD